MHEYANGGTLASTLAKLSREQSTVTNSESQKLFSLDGLQVLVDDNDPTLLNIDTVLNGAALLVLCGVRSESINAGTVDQLLDEQGVSHFKHLIDGGRFVAGRCSSKMLPRRRGGSTLLLSPPWKFRRLHPWPMKKSMFTTCECPPRICPKTSLNLTKVS